MTEKVVFEFKVSRRIGWDDEGAEELREHFKAVCNEMAIADGVARLNVRADLERASLEMEVDVVADSAFQAEAWAREALGEAIRGSGAMHVGLLSEADEAKVHPSARLTSPLKTPRWIQRRAEVVG
jgi:hypothetical protein